MINALLIDDEEHCRESLSIQLARYTPQVRLLASCGSGVEGLKAINQLHPDVVFLDVEMPHMNGFELLEQCPAIGFRVIFTTGYDTYAIQAIRFSALDYLLKPIEKDELIKAVAKINDTPAPMIDQQLGILRDKLEYKPVKLQKIALPSLEGFKMVPLEAILRCESTSNYTYIFLKNNRKLLVSRTLKEIEELLDGHSFLRVHHSHVVNLNEIECYVRGEGGCT
ncbi:LytR/AlgR family response regulator transcription factor [Spirosoma pulveris]